MTREINRRFPHALLITLSMTSYTCGAYSIIEPAHNQDYVSTATIAARGETQNLNETVTIKLMLDGDIVDSANATAPPQGINWDTEFDPPSGGWELSDDYLVELWAGNPSAKQASVGIDVI